ncbi:MAG: HAMP domain-containing sensor histidine kinase [Campylobacterota bacterium]|nr:HAMP domain-containing sensor histidine kinase [Campylobacterota bacterium]
MAKKSTQQYLRSSNVDKNLLSNLDNGIIILDEDLIIYHYNHWLEIHTSLKEKDLIDKKISSIFPNINSKTLLRKIKTALRMGTPTFYTANTSKYLIPIKINQLNVSSFKHMRQDVTIIPFDKEQRLVALIIIDQTNMTNTNILLELNIKKVKELNSELIKERETIDQKVLLIKFDNEHHITNVSQAYINLIQCSEKESFSGDFFEYHKLYIDEELKKSILLHMKEKKVLHFENRILSHGGEELILSYTLVPEYNSYAQHIGFILFMQNVTSTKKVIEQQEKLLSTSRSAAMGEMISMIAHQWRQPLAVINTIVTTLKIKREFNTLEDNDLDDSFLKIEKTVTYLSETINDFRDYFKPNKQIQNISLSDIMQKSTLFLMQEIKLLSINYSESIEKDITIKTYKNELVQCIINILKNSIDAFRNSEIKERSITVDVKVETTLVSLSFKDNAGGIESDIIQKVFDPYFSTKSKNGTGLGLYMTKTIIEEHLNGKITLTSSDGCTNLLIELPYFIKHTKETQ